MELTMGLNRNVLLADFLLAINFGRLGIVRNNFYFNRGVYERRFNGTGN